MDLNDIIEFCFRFKGSEEIFLFDKIIFVFKVMGKMYVLIDIYEFNIINLKCDFEMVIDLCEWYEEIELGWYMNKSYWNMVNLCGNLKDLMV